MTIRQDHHLLSPLDYQQFERRVRHHGTVPAAVTPGQPFMQMLEVVADTDGNVPDPSVVVWCFDPGEGVAVAWFHAGDMDAAHHILKSHEQWRYGPSAARLVLLKAAMLGSADSYHIGIAGLDELLSGPAYAGSGPS